MKKVFLCFLFLLPTQVFAEDLAQGVFSGMIRENYQEERDSAKFSPKFRGQFLGDLAFDDNYQATKRQNEYKNAYLKGRLAGKLQLNKNFSVGGLLRLKQVTNESELNRRASLPDGGGNRYFDNELLYIQEITVNYDQKNLGLVAGKFTPNFGTAWRWGRGIWANEIAKNYKEVEKLGVGGVYKAGDLKRTGQYNFGFAAFTNDRNNLDNSVITNRDSDSKSDAKPGDTKTLKSYVASVDVLFDFSEKEKLSYHFAYIDQAVNSRATSVSQTKLDSQKGYVAGLNYRYPISENFLLDSLLEYVRMKNINGNSDVGEQYSTASFVGEIYKNWNLTVASTNLVHKEYGQNGYDQNLAEISAGYTFDKTVFFDRLLLQIGYKNTRVNYKTSVETNNSYGVLLRYIKSF